MCKYKYKYIYIYIYIYMYTLLKKQSTYENTENILKIYFDLCLYQSILLLL